MEHKRGKTAQYKRDDGLVVDVEMFVENGLWYARLRNDKAVFPTGEHVCNCGQERAVVGISASPWCLEVSDFGKRYKPVASPPKLGNGR